MSSMPYVLDSVAATARFFLLLYCVAQLALAWLAGLLLDLYTTLEAPNMTQAQMNVASNRLVEIGTGVYGLAMVAFIGCYIAVGIWIYRATANAQARVPDPARIKPKWAVGWNLVPIANLYLPYVAIRQTWNGLNGAAALSAPMPFYAPIWWLCWLATGGIAATSLWVNTAAETMDQFRLSARLDLVASAAGISAALVLRHLISEMTRASGQPSDTSHPKEYAQ